MMWSMDRIAWMFLTGFAAFCIFGALAGQCQAYAKKEGKMAGIVMRVLCYGSLAWLLLNLKH